MRRDVNEWMETTVDDIRRGMHALGIEGRPVCLHSSLRSFGHVDGGPAAVVGGLLSQGCTVLVPSFSWNAYFLSSAPGPMPDRNGWESDPLAAAPAPDAVADPVFSTASTQIDSSDMGRIPAWLVSEPGRARSDHALCSFAALGPSADQLTREQSATNVFGPLKALCRAGGWVVLAGVGLESMTLLHLAEELAGRRMFVRWAADASGRPAAFDVGGCSAGFGRLSPVVEPLARGARVGESEWRAYPGRQVLEVVSPAIRADPSITHCGRSPCRCDDALHGGPVWNVVRPHTLHLDGPRVRLRPMTEDDWPHLEEWNADAEVLWFTEGDDVVSRSPDEVRGIYRAVSQNALCFMIEVQGEPIGECWLQRMNLPRLLDKHPGRDVRRIDIAIGRKDLWGRGYGTEAVRLLVDLAFTSEGADTVYGLVGGHNPRSRAMFMKAGFLEAARVPEAQGSKASFAYDLAIDRRSR